MTKTLRTLTIFAGLAALLLVGPAAAQVDSSDNEEPGINIGTFASTVPPLRIEDVTREADPDDLTPPSVEIKGADHVVNGVALRNRTSGTIHLRGVPLGSTVIRALLYWNFSDLNVTGSPTAPAVLNGNVVIGNLTADSMDPCWGMAGSHSYMADVTALVPATLPNQDYQVVLPFTANTTTSGQNPWNPPEFPNVRPQGAWLIVIFKNANTLNPVFVYDNLPNSMFAASASFNLSHSLLGNTGLFSMGGADGQRGGGHDNSLSNELTFFNGAQIAGPPVTNSDWDGSDGWPLVQLADTHTHIVNMTGLVSNVSYTSNGDCLVPVFFVLDP